MDNNNSKFLDNLLDSAISFYSKNNDISKKPLPIYFNNIDDAINLLENSLKFEASEAMSQEIVVDEVPILHAANLNTKAPGIITGETKKKKLILHKKKKIKKNSEPKQKTPEQLEKELLKLKEREEAKDHSIEIFSAPPLARALYFTTNINEAIPPDLYYAVAQVIAYVFNLNSVSQDGLSPEKPNPDIPSNMKFDSDGKKIDL